MSFNSLVKKEHLFLPVIQLKTIFSSGDYISLIISETFIQGQHLGENLFELIFSNLENQVYNCPKLNTIGFDSH